MKAPFQSLSIVTLVAALGAGSGCIIHDNDTYVPPPQNEPTGPGDITFQWSFDGERQCNSAGVEEVDVLVVQNNEILFADTVECFGGGLTLTDFSPGSYDLVLDAFSRTGRLLFQGDASVRVRGEANNDIGLVRLDPVGPSTGELALFWSFLYPTDDSEVYTCGVAGVDTVHVDLAPLGASGDGFSGTFDCADEGVIIDGLPAGSYELTLVGDGSYQGGAIALYEGVIDVDVVAGATSDLGDVPLLRVFESFADIEVAWDVAGGTCGGLGLDEVTLVITRLNGDIEDDIISLDCATDYALRETFVPGSYLVEVFGTGIDGDFFGSATRDVAPNTTAEVLVEMVLTP
jgi:hypothetical protein